MKATVVYIDKSEINTYRVVDGMYEGRMSRVLYSGNNTPQSGLALDDDPELLFDYNQRLLEVAQSINPKSVLVIGGGAFTLPIAIKQQLPDTEVDVVEIDGLLPDIAQTFFGLDVSLGINVIIQDGRSFIADTNNKYDFIIIDAFSGGDIVEDLLSADSAKLYHRHLNENGVVAMNFIAKYRTRRRVITHDLLDNFSHSFEAAEVYPADHRVPMREEQNLILLASQHEMPRVDYLQSAPVEVMPAYW